MKRWATEDFEDSETTLYDIMINACHYMFVKTYSMYNTRSESSAGIERRCKRREQTCSHRAAAL